MAWLDIKLKLCHGGCFHGARNRDPDQMMVTGLGLTVNFASTTPVFIQWNFISMGMGVYQRPLRHFLKELNMRQAKPRSLWPPRMAMKELSICFFLETMSILCNIIEGAAGQTALFAASENGHEGIVKSLLAQNGVAINTALIGASSGGQEGIVKLLLSRNDVGINAAIKPGHYHERNGLGETALFAASKNSALCSDRE
jgi:ankyrin repeat protein